MDSRAVFENDAAR